METWTCRILPYSPDNFGVTSFAEDEQEHLLIASYAGVRRLLDGRIEPYPSCVAPITRMFRDRDGALWIGIAEHGLMHVHEARHENFKRNLPPMSQQTQSRHSKSRFALGRTNCMRHAVANTATISMTGSAPKKSLAKRLPEPL